jgi:cullin-associated NEDD8-dissociated protein 1
LAYMSYDPNYSFGMDDDDDEPNNEDEDLEDEYDKEDDDDYEEEESEDEDDDEDDESWKVWRSAIRALKAVVEAKRHDPSTLWATEYPMCPGKSVIVAMALVGRFKERVQNCRVGILDSFTRLLAAVTVKASDAGVISIKDANDETAMDTTTTTTLDKEKIDLSPISAESIQTMASFLKLQSRSLNQFRWRRWIPS